MNAFQASGEFSALTSTLYGSATSDNQRTESFVNNFYLGAYGRNATSTELQQQRDPERSSRAGAESGAIAGRGDGPKSVRLSGHRLLNYRPAVRYQPLRGLPA